MPGSITKIETDTCVVDFDETLLAVDSLRTILVAEHWYFDPIILLWGSALFLAIRLLPRSRQHYYRRKFKFRFLCLLEKNKDHILEKYSKKFAKQINQALVDYLNSNYSRIFVVTASWTPLVEHTLANVGCHWPIYGTDSVDKFENFFTNWHSEKLRALSFFSIDQFDVYTDSKDDAPLAGRARSTYLVRPNQVPPYESAQL